jgi:hypothetical protein
MTIALLCICGAICVIVRSNFEGQWYLHGHEFQDLIILLKRTCEIGSNHITNVLKVVN